MSDYEIEIDVAKANAALAMFNQAMGRSAAAVEAGSRRMGNASRDAETQMTSAFARKAKAIGSLDHQMAGLLSRFFGIGGLIMGFKALATGVADISPEAQRAGKAFDALSDNLFNTIANSDLLKVSMDGLTYVLKGFSAEMDVINKVVSTSQGAIGKFAALVDIVTTGGKNIPDWFYEDLAAQPAVAPRPKRSEQKSKRGGKGGGRLDLSSLNEDEERDTELLDYLTDKMEDKSLPMADQAKMADDYLKGLEQVATEEKAILEMRSAAWEEFSGQVAGVTGGMVSTIIGGLAEMAKGHEVAWDKLIADFLVQQGTMAFAQGAATVASGITKLPTPAFAAGIAEIQAGGIAMAIGGVMLAGGLPMMAAAYAGGGGGSLSAPSSGAGGGMGGGGSQTIERHYVINVQHIGGGDPATGRALAQHLNAAMREAG